MRPLRLRNPQSVRQFKLQNSNPRFLGYCSRPISAGKEGRLSPVQAPSSLNTELNIKLERGKAALPYLLNSKLPVFIEA
jgi:hypothetical protein